LIWHVHGLDGGRDKVGAEIVSQLLLEGAFRKALIRLSVGQAWAEQRQRHCDHISK